MNIDKSNTTDPVTERTAGASGGTSPDANGSAPVKGGESAQLLEDVRAHVRRYIVVTDEQAVAITLWVVHTHVLGATYITPYLSVTSAEMQCGKTQLLELLEELVAKGLLSAGQSVAAVYRYIAKVGEPTLLLDEVDAVWNETGGENEQLRSIINAGNRRSGKVLRCINFGRDVEVIPAFGPKALGGIGRLPSTIADRSIPIRMRRKTDDEMVAEFVEEQVAAEGMQLRERLEEWGKANVARLKQASPTRPPEWSDRQKGAGKLLLAIADLAGGEWEEAARRSLTTLFNADKAVQQETLALRLLKDCKIVFDKPKQFSAWLVDDLKKLPDSPWEERELDVNKLAWLLGKYDIKARKVRIDKNVLQGYRREDFVDAWTRFVPVEADDEDDA